MAEITVGQSELSDLERAASRGGGFLFAPVGSRPFTTPEQFSPDQREFYRAGTDFRTKEIMPHAERLERKDNALMHALIGKAGELGLLSVDLPEAFGGLGLDKTTSMLVAESQASYGAWATTFGAQTGIGTLPIVFFGTPAQKAKYLPDLASGRKVAAYALSEAGSGSDALGARTVARLSADGTHYLVNGSKMWITNGGFADVFVVFLKIDGDKFTAMIVEKDTPGFSIGREEHKLGIRGSSTTPLIFEDARVPAGNVLGQIGKGHKIAFNILNIGRLKLAAFCIGGMKDALKVGTAYAAERKQFDKPIASFGLIREKLARGAALTYAVETMTYRASGSIDQLIERSAEGLAKDDPRYDAAVLHAGRTLAVDVGDRTSPLREALCRFFCMESRERSITRARTALCALVPAEEIGGMLERLEKLSRYQPVNPAEVREAIVAQVLEAGGYPLGY